MRPRIGPSLLIPLLLLGIALQFLQQLAAFFTAPVFIGLLMAMCAVAVAFVLFHMRPLTYLETCSLAAKRRRKAVRRYFSYSMQQMTVSPEFKARMNAQGQLYRINDRLSDFPGRAAGLLKGKKHEWIVCAFERHQNIEFIWVNKGVKERVPLGLPFAEMQTLAERHEVTSNLILHNHPNSNPSRLDLLVPSSQDLTFSQNCIQFFNGVGITVALFICERGRFREFAFSACDSFLPLEHFKAGVVKESGISKSGNLRLHLQRFF
jgi:hypothetical protein